MLRRFWFHLRMYAAFQFVHIRNALSYEADFWIGAVGVALTHGVGIVFVWVLFGQIPEVGGWRVWDIALLYALSIIPRGLTELLCDGQWALRSLINRGELDRLLIRPISPALQLITQFCSVHGLGSILLGGIVLSRTISELGLVWDWATWLLLVVTLISGTIMMSAINLATNCIGFWDQSANSSFPFMVQNMAEFAKFPISLYDRLVQVALTLVVPFACVSYFPGLVLLNRPEAQPWMASVAPIAACVVLGIAAIIWQQGLARYQGTGH